MAESEGILSGLRVVDTSWGLSGPVAAMLLAEAGADVIKVEPPLGDPWRATPGFATWNRSKRGIELDLASPAGLAAFHDLLRSADVLIHGFRPSQCARFGIDAESMRARYPGLVVAGVTGYPSDHPDAERPGYDVLVQARLGMMDLEQGYRDGPIFLRMPLASWGAAYLSAIAVVARLLLRLRTGIGGPAATSIMQGGLAQMRAHWSRTEHDLNRPLAKLPQPYRGQIKCGDGVWLHIMGAPNDVPLMAKTLADLTPEEWAIEESGSDATRVRPGRTASGRLTPGQIPDLPQVRLAFGKRPSYEWLPELWAHDVAVLPCLALGEALFDEQAAIAGYVVEVDDPLLGRVRQAGAPFRTSPPSRVRRAAPRLGEHTAEVLSEARPEVTAASTGRSVTAPLAGTKVLDLGQNLAGPYATMMFADLGADVIKVEPPTGDMMRFAEAPFIGCQRGKRSIAIDLRNPEARPVIEELVRWADVVHHNMRMPGTRRLGLDYESVRALNPTVVYCHNSGYGPVGPRADWGGFDQIFQAFSGWEQEGSGEGNAPMWHRSGVLDYEGAMASAVATMLALYHRERTGVGQFVSASILGAAILTLSETYIRADGALAPLSHLDRDQTGTSPSYRIYRAHDGWVAVASSTSAALATILQVAGCETAGAIEAAFVERDADELAAALEDAGVAAEVVRESQLDAFLDNPQSRKLGLVASFQHPKFGLLEEVGRFWDFGDAGLVLDRTAPRLGEHTVEILKEIGFADDIDRLADNGAVIDPARSPEAQVFA